MTETTPFMPTANISDAALVRVEDGEIVTYAEATRRIEERLREDIEDLKTQATLTNEEYDVVKAQRDEAIGILEEFKDFSAVSSFKYPLGSLSRLMHLLARVKVAEKIK